MVKPTIYGNMTVTSVGCGNTYTMYTVENGDVYILGKFGEYSSNIPKKIEEFKNIKYMNCGSNCAAVIIEKTIGLETDMCKWVDNQSLSDISFVVEDRIMYGHKIILR